MSRKRTIATPTSGGNRLRALREYRRRTQLDVELDASLGTGYLQRVESGKVRSPERDTLERILTALETTYTERRDLLELFGYVVDIPLPVEAEIQAAIVTCQTDLNNMVFPAYLLDCGHRLLTWNGFLPSLFSGDLPSLPAPDNHIAMLRVLFDPMYRLRALISNPDIFFPAQIRALRYEMHLFRAEGWNQQLIDELLKECPLFAHYWTEALAVDKQNDYLIAARPLVPLELNIPGGGVMCFRLTAEPFAQDRRFRLIYYIPADSATIQQCVKWLEARTP